MLTLYLTLDTQLSIIGGPCLDLAPIVTAYLGLHADF